MIRLSGLRVISPENDSAFKIKKNSCSFKIYIKLAVPKGKSKHTYKRPKKGNSVAGNRTRVSWVKARYPNRWTTTDLMCTTFALFYMLQIIFFLANERRVSIVAELWNRFLFQVLFSFSSRHLDVMVRLRFSSFR